MTPATPPSPAELQPCGHPGHPVVCLCFDPTTTAATTRTTEGERITSVCSVCGDSIEAPNKGLGRATVAAWETNHGRNCDG